MKKRFWTTFGLLILLLFVPSITTAEVEEKEYPPITTENLEAFVHQFLGHTKEYKQPGRVVLVVKDGGIVYQEGFGYANLQTETKVDTGDSLFRIGSITKLFTATAIMQLIEQGLVDVEQDVNHYLSDFQIDSQRFSPIKVKHLLTHTPGFDDPNLGTAAEHYSERLPLREFLKDNQPKMINEPGQYFLYSNYGMGLLGLIIEEVTGLSYEKYIEEYILKPLGMNQTHVTMNPAVEKHLVRENMDQEGNLEWPLYDVQTLSAGAMLSTAEDMAKFMFVHLQEGTWNDITILQQETAKRMHEQQFSQHPLIQGIGYGFFERLQGSSRFIEHGGALIGGTNTLLAIDKEENLGIFIANINPNMFMKRFTDHFYPPSQAVVQQDETRAMDTEESLKRYEGNYQTNRYSHEDPTKLQLALFPSYIKVSSEGNNSLKIWNRSFEQVEPLLFVDLNSNQYIAFDEDAKGNIAHLFLFDGWVYEKMKGYQYLSVHEWVINLFLLFIVVTIIIGITILIKRTLKKNRATHQHGASKEKWYIDYSKLNMLLCLSFLFYLLLFVFAFSQMNHVYEIVFNVPSLLKIGLILPFLLIGLSILQGISLIRAWILGIGSIVHRLYCSVGFTFAICVLLILQYYNLIGL